MNWDAIGAIGELVGGIAVIGTLIYLASQIRQNTKINASAIRQNFYDYTTRQMLHGTDSAEFSALIAKVSLTDEALSPGESIQILRMFQAVFVGYQGAFVQYKQGALSEDDWKMCRALLRSYWLFPGKEMARQWEQFKAGGFLDDGFVAECEKLRDEAQQYKRGLEEKNLQFAVS
ncbi:MAG: hypothetical protein ACI88G_000260 [Woeseiaceae bacterium]|jgi:hypothetical protein